MTDEQIIKALEICENYKETCEYCPYDNIRHCADEIRKDTLGLIKRQQAEIEALKKTNPLFEYAAKSVHQYIEDGKVYYVDFVQEEYEAEAINEKIDYLCHIQDIRTEAIKEFADKLKAGYNDFDEQHEVILYDNLVCAIDDLVDEMVGADNE